MYTYLLKYEHEKDIYQLPIPPEQMITKSKNTNKKYETVGAGEVNLLKDIGIREISMSIILPNDLNSPIVQPKYASNVILEKPIFYLSKFREFKANKKPVQLLITRVLPSGEQIFEGNILLSLDEYTVYENAGEEGDFYVDLVFREYININSTSLVSIDENSNTYAVSTERTTKEVSSTYTVQEGDTLWKIAKKELNDETMYQKLMQLNNISDPKKLQIGTVLRLS